MARSLDKRLDEIRASWSVAAVLSRYGYDTGNGSLAPCPFCYDSQGTPARTFHYNDRLWHCFYASCPTAAKGKSGGDIFNLVQALEGCSFVQSVKILGGPDQTIRPHTKTLQPGGRPAHSHVFQHQDLKQERVDFLKLEELINRDHCHRLKMLEIQHNLKMIEDDSMEFHRARIIADTEILWAELDRIRSQLLYYLGCHVEGRDPAYPGHKDKKKPKL